MLKQRFNIQGYDYTLTSEDYVAIISGKEEILEAEAFLSNQISFEDDVDKRCVMSMMPMNELEGDISSNFQQNPF